MGSPAANARLVSVVRVASSGLRRKFCLALLTRRMRSAAGLKSVPQLALSGRVVLNVPVPTWVTTPVSGLIV